MIRETAYCGVDLMGFEFFVTIDFTYTPGRPATWCRRIGTWDPPDPPEWQIERITLQLDEIGKDAPEWELTGSMFDCIAEHPSVVAAVETFSDWSDRDAP